MTDDTVIQQLLDAVVDEYRMRIDHAHLMQKKMRKFARKGWPSIYVQLARTHWDALDRVARWGVEHNNTPVDDHRGVGDAPASTVSDHC